MIKKNSRLRYDYKVCDIVYMYTTVIYHKPNKKKQVLYNSKEVFLHNTVLFQQGQLNG